MLPVLSIAVEGEARVPAVARIIADQLGPTDDEREEMLPSGKQRLLHNCISRSTMAGGSSPIAASGPSASFAFTLSISSRSTGALAAM